MPCCSSAFRLQCARTVLHSFRAALRPSRPNKDAAKRCESVRMDEAGGRTPLMCIAVDPRASRLPYGRGSERKRSRGRNGFRRRDHLRTTQNERTKPIPKDAHSCSAQLRDSRQPGRLPTHSGESCPPDAHAPARRTAEYHGELHCTERTDSASGRRRRHRRWK